MHCCLLTCYRSGRHLFENVWCVIEPRDLPSSHEAISWHCCLHSRWLGPDWLHLQVCGVSLKSGTYPVPVIPVAEIADLAPVLDASYAVHDQLQHTFHTTFVMG